MRNQVLEEIERRGIQPLQIVKKQRDRVLLPREDAEEAPKHHLEAVLRVLRGGVPRGRLFADDELQLGNEIDDELPIRGERLAQRISPQAEFYLALAQKRAHEALEGLRQRGIRNVGVC